MGRNKKNERKIGKTSAQGMRRALYLVKEGRSLHQAAETIRIPYSTVRRYLITTNASFEPILLVPRFDKNRVFNKH